MNNQNSVRDMRTPIPFAEFVGLLALLMSLVALSIDSILPGLPLIGQSYNVSKSNDLQYIVTFLFLGLALGQFLAGPLSDAIGRKNTMYIGLVIFTLGSIASFFAQSFEFLLAMRFIQGLGASAPRVVTIAMVRDQYEGRDMARIMSYVMGVFILVPTIAPTVGLGVMMISSWKMIFLFYAVIAIICLIWSAYRLRETLAPEDKRPLTAPVLWQGLVTVCTNRMTACYTVAAGAMFGGLIGYINSAQQIFQDYYDTGNLFSIYFGLGALSLGAAFFMNGLIVKQYGMRYVALRSSIVMSVIALLFLIYAIASGGAIIALPIFMAFMMICSFCMGLCFGNLNALAMVPMGHIAGMASAVIGAVSLIISLLVGNIVGQSYDGNLIPIGSGFLVSSMICIGMIFIAERGHVK